MKSLQHQVHKPVHIGAFHPTFFPPGYVAENIRLASESSNSGTPTMMVRKLVIAADYSDILLMRKKIERVSIIGLHLTVPSGPSNSESQNQSASTHQTPPKFSEIRHVKIENSVVEFSSPEPDEDPLKITAKDVAFDGVTRTGPASFRAELATNEPSGAIHSTGQLGPWNWDDAGQTPLTGSFTFNRADLSTVGNIEGRLNAKGRFSGPLRHVACSGTVDVPQFGTSDGSHTLPLSTTFHATVNGLNGDTTLDDAESRLNRTVIKSQGEIKGDNQQAGKTAHLRLRVDDGQIDDLLLLFTHNRYSSMTGTISLRANVELPPGAPEFLKRLRLQGDFGMSDSRFTKASTQTPINHLSKSAEGMSKGEEKEDTRTVLSDITGHVSAQNGIATLSRVSFTVPNANAKMSGTYNLLDKAVHLEGTLRTTGKISDTTSGLKAGLLKVISPFLKKHSVTVVPFKITGTAQNSTVALDLAREQRF
ncbi:MAG: AsmA-like C-terminal region-containing protein [Bryobacteraceae bacterium]